MYKTKSTPAVPASVLHAIETMLSRPPELDEPINSPTRQRTTRTGANRRALERITVVRDYLLAHPDKYPILRPHPDEDAETATWWEAQRTNWIEGRIISLSVAQEHYRTGCVPFDCEDSNDTSRDTVHAYELIRATRQRPQTWDDADAFLQALQATHGQWFRHRPDIAPGQWKPIEIHVDGRLFTPPAHVEPTLRAAWQLAQTVPAGDARATVIEYSIIEIHPFVDGNGRCSRFMANHVLSRAREQRLVTPEPYWDEYCTGLDEIYLDHGAEYWLRHRHWARCCSHTDDWLHRPIDQAPTSSNEQ